MKKMYTWRKSTKQKLGRSKKINIIDKLPARSIHKEKKRDYKLPVSGIKSPINPIDPIGIKNPKRIL